MKTKTLGIVGGLGPDATAAFYTDLVCTMLKLRKVMPSVLIQSVPISYYLCEQITHNYWSEAEKRVIYTLLRDACQTLEAAGADYIVIPCNSVHLFVDELRTDCKVPIISIIDATQAAIRKTAKKVAILATRTTIETELYQKSLLKNGMMPVVVDDATQNQLTEMVLRVVQNLHTTEDIEFMKKLILNLTKNGCDAIILGCTELPLLVQSDERIISSLTALKRAVVPLLATPLAQRAPLYAA
jgi:aspartate racemase